MLWNLNQYYFIYFVTQTVAALARGPLSAGSCIPLTHTPIVGGVGRGWGLVWFCTSFTDWHKMLLVHLYVSCPSPRISHFSKELRAISHKEIEFPSQDVGV